MIISALKLYQVFSPYTLYYALFLPYSKIKIHSEKTEYLVLHDVDIILVQFNCTLHTSLLGLCIVKFLNDNNGLKNQKKLTNVIINDALIPQW